MSGSLLIWYYDWKKMFQLARCNRLGMKRVFESPDIIFFWTFVGVTCIFIKFDQSKFNRIHFTSLKRK